MNSSARITRGEVTDLCEAIHAAGPLPVFGVRVPDLHRCVRLRSWATCATTRSRSCSPRSTASGSPPSHGSSRTPRTWRVLHTGRRRPLGAFPVTITAVLGLI